MQKEVDTSIFERENQTIETEFIIEKGCLIVYLREELDHHNALMIREKSDKLIERGHVHNIIFDFTDSSFMDSSGIGVIMGRYRKIIFTGGKVAVTNVNSSIDRIFTMSGLYKIIERYETIQDAIEAF